MEWDTETLIFALSGLLLFLFGFLLGQKTAKGYEPPRNKWDTPSEPSWEQPYPSVPSPPILPPLPPLPPPRPESLPSKPELMMDDLYRM